MDFIAILKQVIGVFAKWAGVLLVLLPDSPIQAGIPELGSNETIRIVAWFLPIAEIVGIMQVFLLATITWYFVRWILRFVRYIG